jgi:hypothetical protein
VSALVLAASASAAPLPAYASVTFNVSSGSAWTTVDLVGGSVVDSAVTSTSRGKVSVGASGIALSNPLPSPREGANTLPPAQTTVNLVYSFSLGAQLTLRVCKSDVGSTSAAVTRNEGQDRSQVASLIDSNSNQAAGSDGCVNESIMAVTPAALSGPNRWPAPLDGSRHVLAIYYPWYDSTTFQSGSWAETATPPFDTSDPASVGAQIDAARAQQIDGFVVSYGGTTSGAQRLSSLTQEAAARPGFHVAPMIEMDQLAGRYPSVTLVSGVDSAIADAVARTAGPAQLQVNGRPVVFVFGAEDVSPLVWQTIRLHLSQNPFFVGDSLNGAYGFSGLFNYTSNFAADNQIAGLDQSYERVARWDAAVGGGSQRLWVAPASPGEDNCVSPTANQRVYVSRENGARYDYAWQAAYASEPEWVLLSTWNEWFEDTAVAPGSVNAGQSLQQTGSYAQSFQTDPFNLPDSSFPAPGSANDSRNCP